MENELSAYKHTQKLFRDVRELKAKQRESFYIDPTIQKQIDYLHMKMESMKKCVAFLQSAFENALKYPETFSEKNIKKFRVSPRCESNVIISRDYDVNDPLILSHVCRNIADEIVNEFYWTGTIFYPIIIPPKFLDGMRIVIIGIRSGELQYKGIEFYLDDNKPMKDLLESQIVFRYSLM